MPDIRIKSAPSSAALDEILADRLHIDLSVPASAFTRGLAEIEKYATPDPGHTYDWNQDDLRFSWGLIASLLTLVPLEGSGFICWLAQNGFSDSILAYAAASNSDARKDG